MEVSVTWYKFGSKLLIHIMENTWDLFGLNFKDGKIRVQRHLVANQTNSEASTLILL
jgi:hypothetical protein